MIDPTRYRDRPFDLQTNNCAHFVRDVWKDHTGTDLGDWVPRGLTYSNARKAFGVSEDAFLARTGLRELPGPEEPSLVLILVPSTMPHCGVWVDGKLLHMDKSGKVRHEPLEVKSGTRVRYFK